MTAVRVLIADDAVIWREGVARLLEEAGMEVVAQAGDTEELTLLADEHRPDVAIVDVRMPPTYTDDGLRAALWIRRNLPDIGVLVLSQAVYSSPAVELLGIGEAGCGYLLKDRVSEVRHLIDAVQVVAAGGSVIDPLVSERLVARAGGGLLGELTEREREVLRLLAEGRANQAIAEELVVTLKTVESHVSTLLLKLGISTEGGGNRRVLAVLRYLRETAASSS